ncbi:hypothetical protein PH210_27060 [Paenibacillus sp. BSR1-1]|uniref:hypothetical protein n=1 Tax=Paenibacillus sp. BSR1-1 TaxID=3020845 RepID=UPI0025AF9037|nr:hypothetical protein [Paenibacillus sp. BSR1-1]MDN3019829.1 hypothetical protein [Paenibacillus sp. BSR1-1]
MKKLNSIPSKLSSRQNVLADKLVSLNQFVSPYAKLRAYNFGMLRKGLTCCACHSFKVSLATGKLICIDCGCEEAVDTAVLRSVEEIKLLFPDMRITTNVVQEWCGWVSIKTIRRVLKENYISTGKKEYSFLNLK